MFVTMYSWTGKLEDRKKTRYTAAVKPVQRSALNIIVGTLVGRIHRWKELGQHEAHMIQLFETELAELLCEGYSPKNLSYNVHRLRSHDIFFRSGREFITHATMTL